MRSTLITAVLVAAAAACAPDSSAEADADAAPPAAERDRAAATAPATMATALGSGDADLDARAIEAGRLDESWRPFAERDARERRQRRGAASATADTSGTVTGGTTAQEREAAPDSTEAWEDISAESLRGTPSLPLSGDVAGPSVAMVQIALDRALFSPGIIDGRWGKNTEKAVFWLQERYGLPGSGEVNAATWERLQALAGGEALVRRHTLTEADVSGPFVEIPEGIYEQAELDCMCFESQVEQLAERFHSSRELLAQLNPEKDLAAVRAGETLVVPAVRGAASSTRGQVARIVISDGGHYLHAEDAQGRILYHFPSTLGSEYAPSPGGTYEVTSIAPDPTWHYQPDLLTGEPDSREDAIIPSGPNNPVGVVWMQLSKDHYGIHGTAAPATIGYVTSHGCVRLTNWDAEFLRQQVSAGTPVEFVSGSQRG